MTNSRPLDLPDFGKPPVVETVLSVQFDSLARVRTAHFGLYWAQIRERFPQTEERGELPPAIELLEAQSVSRVGIQFEALEAPPSPRFWFVNSNGTELIQVQRDRFIKNWRKTGDGLQYPRYESVREGFDRDFAGFRDFVSRNELGEVRVNQCEITYINHIISGAGWTKHTDISKVLNIWRQPETSFPGPAQDLAFRARFPILDQNGTFVGRLHVGLQSVLHLPEGTPMLLLELTARGQLGGGMDFFDLGREWIVRSFKEITTPDMHKIWELRS